MLRHLHPQQKRGGGTMQRYPLQASLPGWGGGHCPSLPREGVLGLRGREGEEGAKSQYPQG